ncbi:unnamed protein product [Camellia sinensis]
MNELLTAIITGKTNLKRVSLLEFSHDRKMMTVLCSRKQMEIMFSTGAPESIISRCTSILCNDDGSTVPLTANIRTELESRFHSLESATPEMVGMLDPPREEVRNALLSCMTAQGITSTAESLCQKIGAFDNMGDFGGHSYTASEFEELPALQKAMALQRMTLFTRSASDMVLADDNFATIVAAVAEGRAIYNNTKQFIRCMISSNIGEVVCIFVAAVQLLWVNLVTDGLPASAIGFNKPDCDVMKAKPRKVNEAVVSGWLFFRYLVIGAYVGLATIAGFIWWFVFADSGPKLPYVELADTSYPCSIFNDRHPSTVSMTVLVVVEMFNALNNLSENQSLLVTPLSWAEWIVVLYLSFPRFGWRGKSRARDAALNAVQSPLLDIGIEKATRIVWNITAGSDLTLFESMNMAKKRFRTCNLEKESQNKRSNSSSQPSQSNNCSQPSQPNNPSQLNAPSGTSQSSHSIGSPQMDWPNRTSQPSRSNASLQLNRPNETSQPSRSNGSSQPSWSHPSSHAPSHVSHPQPQESEVNPQFEDDLDEDWLREEEMQRTDESTKRNTRGITRMVEVWNLTPEERIMLTFNKDLQAVSTEGGIFSRFIGTIARKPHLCPIKYKNWHEVPDQYKEDCWNIIERRDMIRHRTLKSMGEKWRNWKCSLKAKYYDETKTAAQIVATAPLTVNREHYADLVAYWFSKEGQELSATNKESRREQTSAHTGGSKTYAQHAYDMEQKDKIALDRAKLYIPLHKRKDGTPVNEAAATKIEKLEALMSSQPSSSEGNVGGRISWSPNDIYSQVMGKEHHGRVRGLGFGPTPSKHGFMCNNFDHLRMVSDEERMRDKDTIIELKEQLKTQGDQLQTQGIQLQAQDAVINSLKEQVAFLMSQRHSSSGLQATDGCSGIPDQASPRTHQRSSFQSHEMQPSNRVVIIIDEILKFFSRNTSGARFKFRVRRADILPKTELHNK